MIMVYAQGMALLAVASDKYAYELNLEAVARIWRGGCIIRARIIGRYLCGVSRRSPFAKFVA